MAEEQENPAGGETGVETTVANNNEGPFYKQFGDFADDNAFIEHYISLKSGKEAIEQEAAQLRTREPEYKVGILKDLEQFIETEIATGTDEQTAHEKAASWITNQTRAWKKEAQSNPIQVLLERDRRKFPDEDIKGLEKDLMSAYGLDLKKPVNTGDQEEFDAAMAEYNEAVDRGMRKARKEASLVAEEFEAQKSGLKIHPKVAEYRKTIEVQENTRKELQPKYIDAVKASGSFEIEVEGLKVKAQLSSDELAHLSSLDPTGFADAKGGIDPEKVGGLARRMYIANNFNQIAAQLVNHGKAIGTGKAVNEMRNAGSEGARSRANGGAGEESEFERVVRETAKR